MMLNVVLSAMKSGIAGNATGKQQGHQMMTNYSSLQDLGNRIQSEKELGA